MSFANGYNYRRPVVINHGQVGSAVQTSFPMAFTGTYSFLANVNNGGKVTSASGYDIIFTSDPSGFTKLDHEIDTYTSTTGAVTLWVRIPTLSNVVDTVIYLWYGNPNILISQENKTSVWDSNFQEVYHFGNGSTLNLNDSTSNGFNLTGTNSPTAGTGQVSGGIVLNGTNQSAATSANTNDLSTFTVSGWFKTSNGNQSSHRTVVIRGTTATNINYFIDLDNGASCGGVAGKVRTLFVDTGGTQRGVICSTSRQDDNNWHYVSFTYDGTTAKQYLDNLAVKTSTVTATPATPGCATYFSYYKPAPTLPFPGTLDEFRISSGARLASWYTTEYNNMNSPATFYTVKEEISYLRKKPFFFSLGTLYSQTFVEAYSLSESFIRQTSKVVSDSISLVDTENNAITKSAITETISVSDSVSKQPQKSLSETYSVIESFIKSISRSLTEAFSLVESFAKLITKAVFTETFSVADSAIVKAAVKAISENFSVAETFIKTISKKIAETFSITEVFSAVKTFFKTVTDSLSINDTLLKGPAKVLTDALTLLDNIVRAVTKSVSDTFAITELFSKIRTQLKALSDSLSITEALIVGRAYSRFLLDTFSLSDSISFLKNFIRNLVETFSFVEIFKRVYNGTALIFTKRIRPTNTGTKRTKPTPSGN